MSKEMILNTGWRKVASTIYKKPVDPKIFGQVELDVTGLDKFISDQRKQGLKITFTHIFTLIYARCLKTEVPEMNTYVRRGKIVKRPGIDAMISVLQAEGGMSSVRVPHADRLTLRGLNSFLQEEINKSRQGVENKAMLKKNILTSTPWPVRNWFFKIYMTLTIHWGLSIPFLGLSVNSFGSFVVTNIGSLGLDSGYPALFPSSNIASVLVLGSIKKKPVVINDEIHIRKMMPVSMVLDHRIADASHGGRVARYVKEMIRKPEILL